MFTVNWNPIEADWPTQYADFVAFLNGDPFQDGTFTFAEDGSLRKTAGLPGRGGIAMNFEVDDQKKLIDEWCRNRSYHVVSLEIVTSWENGQIWYTGAYWKDDNTLNPSGFPRETLPEAFQDAAYLAFQIITG